MSHQETEATIQEVDLSTLLGGAIGEHAGSLGQLLEDMRIANMPKLSAVEADAKIDVLLDDIIVELSRGPEVAPGDFETAEDSVMYYTRGHVTAMLNGMDHDDMVEHLSEAPIDLTTYEGCKAALRTQMLESVLINKLEDGTIAFDAARVPSVKSHIANFFPSLLQSNEDSAKVAAARAARDAGLLEPTQKAAKDRVAKLMNRVMTRVAESGAESDSPSDILSNFANRVRCQQVIDSMASKEPNAKDMSQFMHDMPNVESAEHLLFIYASTYVLPFVTKIDKTNPVVTEQPWEYIEAGEAEVFAKLDLILAK